MKTASVLFGLAVSATSTAQANPGNHPVVAHAEVAPHHTHRAPARHSIDAAVRALLRAPVALHAITLAARPLVDENGDVMCGNVMGKGSSHHVCRNRTTGEIVSDTEIER